MIIRTKKPKTKIQAIIYDLDATLLDTEPSWYQADKRMLAEYGIDFTKQKKNQYIGISIGDMLEDLKCQYTINESETVLREKKNSYYLEVALGNISMFPIMEEFYSLILEKDYRIAIASGTAYEVIMKQLKTLEITDDFEFVISADHVAKGKPSPDIYLESASRFELSPDEILVIEDSYHGVSAAKEAGMYCVAIPYYPEPKNREALHREYERADILFKDGMNSFSPEKLIQWIEQS